MKNLCAILALIAALSVCAFAQGNRNNRQHGNQTTGSYHRHHNRNQMTGRHHRGNWNKHYHRNNGKRHSQNRHRTNQ